MGFPLKADEAYRIGLAQWLVPHEELQAKTMEVAGYIASLPPLAAQMAKESLNRGLDIPNLSDASLVDLYRFMALEATEDKDEGHRAWREKRKPVFRGRWDVGYVAALLARKAQRVNGRLRLIEPKRCGTTAVIVCGVASLVLHILRGALAGSSPSCA
jgi:predicted metal-dependent hydrolase